MEIAIIDDLAEERTTIHHLIEDYFKKLQSNTIRLNFSEFESGESFLQTYSPYKYQLIFLDIYMDGITGIEVANTITSQEKSSNIIFFTSSKDHMLDGFDLRVLGYVLKPVKEHKDQLYKAISYALDKLLIDHSTLQVTTEYGPQTIPYQNILYLEISRRTIYIHMFNKTFKLLGQYADYSLPLLKDSRFIECHRNLIVNLDHVATLENEDFILDNKEKLPISRRKKNHTLEQYMTHFINERCD